MYGGGPTIIQDMFFPVISLSNRKVELPALGIANPLNLCFMIAVTQCLLSNQHLAWYLLKQYFKRYLGNSRTIKKRPSFIQYPLN